MTSVDISSPAFETARDYFTSMDAYAPFNVNSYGRIQEACVDPRDTDQAKLTIDIQTPGGLPGRATDRALAEIAVTGTGYNMSTAMAAEARATTDRISGAQPTAAV